MKICILETVPPKIEKNNTIGRTDAHYRNSEIIAKELGAKLLFYKSSYISAINEKYDAIILACNSIGLPYNLITELIHKNNNAKLFYISNEYSNITGGFLNKYKWNIIANHDLSNKKVKCANNIYNLNLNLLFAKNPNNIINKKYDCVYYGTFRRDRESYFKKYIQGDVYLSTSGRGFGGQANFKYFKHSGCSFKAISKLKWDDGFETLNLFRYSLYIEDVYTHTVFNNLANRWYEAGFCNNVVFFDANCWNTIRKSELGHFESQVKDYVVSNHAELMDKIEYCNKDFERHLAIQKGWRLNEMELRRQMIEKLKQIINGTP